MNRFLPLAALAVLACSGVRAHISDTSSLEKDSFDEARPTSLAVHAAPEFHPAGAIAALTLLLCGVAVLKGRRRE
jgi:hypothetical protein